MRRYPIVIGILVGMLTGITVIAVTYLAGQLAGLPFFPFDLFEATTRVLPGALITGGIDLMVKVIMALQLGPLSQTAKLAEQMLALVQFIVVVAVFSAVIAAIARRARPARLPFIGLIVAAVLFVLAVLVEAGMGFPTAGPWLSLVWLALVFAVWGVAAGWLLRGILFTSDEAATTGVVASTRRGLLYLGGTALLALITGTIGVVDAIRKSEPEAEAAPAPGAGAISGTPVAQAPATLPTTSGPAASPPQPTLEARMDPAPGTRPEATDNQDFYRIDINLEPPRIDAATWKLPIDGLVQTPMSLTLDQIRARPAVSQYITLSCISNPLGGELISTSLWTGTRLKDLLQDAGLQPGAQALYIEAADGFYESVSYEDMMDERTLLVYEMNGQPLPVEHGFPLRIYIPNRYGMKQPKWITRMEVLDHPGQGYWVDRGWSAQAIPQTTSVVDAATTKQVDPNANTLSFGGIAYAGARGIGKVEVQVDDTAWAEARLRIPPLSVLTWVQWRYDWPATPGDHVVRVRAYDGQGMLQTTESHPEHPDGATGVFSRAFKV